MKRSGSRVVSRPGSILLVVVLALAMAALVTAGMIQGASAARAAGVAGADRDQLRSLAWSGVLASMTELGGQRASLLQGKDPSLTARWTLYTAGGVRGVVSLRPFGAMSAASECARIDVNGANGADIARVNGLANDAGSIADGGQSWSSPEELREVVGRSGSKPEGLASAAPGLPADEASPVMGESVRAATPEWLSRVTVFSADAEVTRAGADRLDIGSEWDMASAKAAAGDRPGVDAVLEALAADTRRPTTMSGLVAWLSAKSTPPDMWGGVLDIFREHAGVRTRVLDINRADSGTIAGLPGVDGALADTLVAARQRMGEEALASVAWPVEAGVLSPAQLAPLLPRITTRSLVWRVRVIAEISAASDEAEPADVPAAGLGVERPQAPGTAPPVPTGLRMVYDAVIDLTGAAPRLAYLREGTWEGLTIPAGDEHPMHPVTETTAPEVLAPPSLPQQRLGVTDHADHAAGMTIAPVAPMVPHAENGEGARGPRVGRWTGGTPRGGG